MTMRRAAAGVLAALFLVLTAGSAGAEEWKKLPWHLVDYFYQMPKVADFRTLSQKVEIRGSVEPGQYVYLSPLNGKIGGNMFYFGLQTDLVQVSPRRNVGKGVIFSRWGAAKHDDGKPGPGGWVDSLTHDKSGEGDFVSVRQAYDWGPGEYTFRMEARADFAGMWVDLSMTDHRNGRRIEVGSLRFPTPPPAAFDPQPASFVELYGKPPVDPAAPGMLRSPDFRVRFDPPRVNGAVFPTGGLINQSRRVPPFAAPAKTADYGLDVKVGGVVPAR